jgi:hypothetical protein
MSYILASSKAIPFMFNNEIYTTEDLYQLADVGILPSRLGIFGAIDTYDPLLGQVTELAQQELCKN